MRRIGVLMPRPGRSGRQARIAAFLQGCSNWAGSSAATCGSIFAGPVAMPTASQVRGRIGRARARRHPCRWRLNRPPLLQATRSVPIVFPSCRRSGRRPASSTVWRGRAVTPPGSWRLNTALSAKWMELLKEIAPHVTRAAVLRDAAVSSGLGQFGVIQAAGAVARGGGEPGQRARRRAKSSGRSTAFARSFEWRPDRDAARRRVVIAN